LLIDWEMPHPAPYYQAYVNHARETGAALVSYPHGLALVGGHQLTKEPLQTAASFVHGPGQKKLREDYGYPNPIQWCGYPGPRVFPMEPRECRHVLFAPNHPTGEGWMSKQAKQANTEAFRLLLEQNFMLSVRLVGSPEQNGIWDETGVRYIWGQMDGEVNEASVVVGCGTYAANCLARGIPVVMYAQELYWGIEEEDDKSWKMVPGWQDHEDFTRYPYDLEPGELLHLLQALEVLRRRRRGLPAGPFRRLVDHDPGVWERLAFPFAGRLQHD
jgi:hypothetical protein